MNRRAFLTALLVAPFVPHRLRSATPAWDANFVDGPGFISLYCKGNKIVISRGAGGEDVILLPNTDYEPPLQITAKVTNWQ